MLMLICLTQDALDSDGFVPSSNGSRLRRRTFLQPHVIHALREPHLDGHERPSEPVAEEHARSPADYTGQAAESDDTFHLCVIESSALVSPLVWLLTVESTVHRQLQQRRRSETERLEGPHLHLWLLVPRHQVVVSAAGGARRLHRKGEEGWRTFDLRRLRVDRRVRVRSLAIILH